ncbi:MAG: MATE family efflux transporter [Dysgonamonadaceae bacterium]|nr:MATE family efflux transporter [Dysgonamonadaceae bacterium]
MYSNRQILKISYPIFLSLLTQNIIQVISTAFLGRVGEVELGASALGGLFYVAIFTLGFGFSMGGQILIGRRNGEGRFDRIGEIVLQGMVFLLAAALILIPVVGYVSRHGLTLLFRSANVAQAAIEYLDLRIYGLIFAFVNSMFRAFYVGIARTKVLTLNAGVMAGVNVFFDYGLIFGNFGLPEMGISGAALAAVISEAASTLFFVLFSLKTVDGVKYGFRRMRFRWSVVKKVLDISVFMMIQFLFSIGTWMLFFSFIEHLGERELAVSNIIRSFYMLLTIPATAMGSATSTMVSNTIGAGHKEQVLNLVKRGALLSLGVMIVVITAVGLSSEMFVRIYTDDVSLLNDTLPPFFVLLSSLPFFAVGAVLFNAVSGTGNTRMTLVFELITLAVYTTYIWYIVLHLRSSVALAWTSEHLYWGIIAILSLFYLRGGMWKKKQI